MKNSNTKSTTVPVLPRYAITPVEAIRDVADLAPKKLNVERKDFSGEVAIVLNHEQCQKIVFLLAAHWNNSGQRHNQTLALSGVLLRHELCVEDVEIVIGLICKAAEDEEINDRLKCVQDTNLKLEAGNDVSGIPTLLNFFSKEVVDELIKLLPKVIKPSSRPQLCLTDRNLDDVLRQCCHHLVEANKPESIFVSDARLCVVEGMDAPVVRYLSVNSAKPIIAQRMNVVIERTDKQGSYFVKAFPTNDWVASLLESPRYFDDLPKLDLLTEAPVLSPRGIPLTSYGYQAESQMFLGTKAFEHLSFDTEVTQQEAKAAIDWINAWPLFDFPFAEEASRTHTFCFMFQFFVQLLIKGPRPLGFIEASNSSSGKTKLADVIMRASTSEPYVTSFPRDNEEEVRKKIMTALLSGKAYVLLDNLVGKIDSETLCAAITAYPAYTDRILGGNTSRTITNRATWLATANNGRLSDDLGKRSVLIRLVPKCEDPENRTGFKIPNLEQWLVEHHVEFVEKLLIPLVYWVQQGMPRYTGSSGNRMNEWASVMGGICECLELRGFLANTEGLRSTTNDESEAWQQFVSVWWETYQAKEVHAKELVSIAFGLDEEGGMLSSRCRATSLSGKLSSLGHLIKDKRDRIFAGAQISVIFDAKNGNRYRLVPAD